jgi:ssDNA-binding Zn-finger/Zn-ribbon topoisomerase 1
MNEEKEGENFLRKLKESTKKTLEVERCPHCGENLKYTEITDVHGDTHWVGFCNCEIETEDED